MFESLLFYLCSIYMEWNDMAFPFFEGPTNSCPVVPPVWGCGVGEALGPWLAVKSHLLGLWAHKGSARSQFLSDTAHPCDSLQPYSTGCRTCFLPYCPMLVPQRNESSGSSAWNIRLTNTSKSPSVAKKNLSSAKWLFLHLSATQQILRTCFWHYRVWGNTKPEQPLSADLKPKAD